MNQGRLWLAFAIVAGVGLGFQLFRPTDWTDRPETTFDTAPRGHAAVLALLDRFGSVRGRWLSGVSMPPVEDTIWWIAPSGACDDLTDSPSSQKPTISDAVESPEPRAADATDATDANEATDAAEATVSPDAVDAPLASPFQIVVRPWIEAGGTAIVWLPHPPLDRGEETDGVDPASPDPLDVRESTDAAEAPVEDAEPEDSESTRENWARSFDEARVELHNGIARPCDAIMGFPLPRRRLAGLEGDAPPIVGRTSPIVFSVGRAVDRPEAFDYQATRILPGPTLAFFELDPYAGETQSWRPLWIESDDATPLALERRVGKGRLVVIADARIVTNDRLGYVDSSPFVFDWVRDHGAPWLDEHAHGVIPEAGTFRYLATSPAWAAGLGMSIVGMLVIWRGNAWPAREVSEFDPDAPTLAGFVDSMARLYSGTRDYARVFERYRALSLDRIRRALGLAPGTASEIVLSSLRAKAKSWPALGEAGLGQLLTKNIPISDAEDLARNAARLDELVRILRRGRGMGSTGAPKRRTPPGAEQPVDRTNPMNEMKGTP